MCFEHGDLVTDIGKGTVLNAECNIIDDLLCSLRLLMPVNIGWITVYDICIKSLIVAFSNKKHVTSRYGLKFELSYTIHNYSILH